MLDRLFRRPMPPAGVFSRVRRFLVLMLSFAMLAIGLAPPAHAALSPEVQTGLDWLQAQVQADGSLVAENASIALPHQCRAEAALTLARLASVPSQLQAAIDTHGSDVTEFLARQAVVAGAQGANAAATVAALLEAPNDDGGFGGAVGYASNSLDTAYTLRALACQQAFADPSAVAARALGHLSGAAVSGGWGVNGQPNVHTTAQVLLAAHDWRTVFAVGPTTHAAYTWLLAARNSGVYGNVLDDAVGLLALATQTADSTVLQPLATALRSAQSADGSWAGDPFLTALALRALWTVESLPPTATTGGVTGVVLDAATGLPMSGATVQLLELPAMSAASGADGSFVLAGVEPGTYTVRASRLGYESATAGIGITAGMITTLGSISLNPTVLTASLGGQVKNTYGQGLAGAMVSVGTVSALADATGHYVLTGIEPGSATIVASLASYATVTSELVNFGAGQSYTFSPTLYASNTTPPATSAKGKVVDAGTLKAIAGATVTLGTQAGVTASDGSFSFTGITAGAFTLTVSAPGYTGVTASGALGSGANDIGTISLAKVPATTTLTGQVRDAGTADPVAGATVAVQALVTTTDADGRYTVAGVVGNQFDLVVGATGYLGLTQHVSLAQPGDATIDVRLSKLQPAAVSIDSATPGKATYLPTEVLELAVVLRNSSGEAADVIVDALVLDAASSVVLELKANVHGLGNNPPNLPVTVPAGATLDVPMQQLLLRQAAGSYRILVRAYDTTGRAVDEVQTSFVVAGQPVLGGGVIVDPPLVASGAQTPVHFVGQLSNLGNQPVPAGDLTLTVIVDVPDDQAGAQPRVDLATLAAGAPLKDLRGLAKDSAGNFYAVSGTYGDGRVFRVAPEGSVSVVLQIPSGSPNPQLVDVALDGAGGYWVANASAGVVWHADAQGALTKVVVATVNSTVSGIDVDSQGNLLLTGRGASEYRLVRRSPDGTETVLWANGFSSPTSAVKDAAGDLVVTNNADGTLVKVRPSGAIVPFVSGLNRPMGITRDGAGNFLVANNGDGTIAKVTPAGDTATFAAGLNGPVDLRFDVAGDLFVSCQGDHTIRKISPAGAVSVFSRGVADRPQAMKYDAAGALYIAGDDGTVRKFDTGGQLTELAAGLGAQHGLALDGSGGVLVTGYSNGRVTRVDGNGTSVFASGLGNPWGIAVDDRGNVLVSENGKSRLSRFDYAGNLLEQIDSLLSSPAAVTIDGAGNVVVANNGFMTVLEAGVPRRFSTTLGLNHLAPDPAGGGVFGTSGYDVHRVGYDGTSVKLARLPFSPYGIAVDGAGNVLLADYSGSRIYRLDGSNALTVLATTSPARPRFMAGDGRGKVYVMLDNHQLVSLAADGTLTALSSFYVTPSWDYPNGLGMAADGRPMVWTNTGKLFVVDPATGVQMVLKSGVSPSGATADLSGRLYTTESGFHQLLAYDGAGTEVMRISGFASPRDVVWDGTRYWFTDAARTYTLAPGAGQYPMQQSAQTMTGLGVTADGALWGVKSGQLYRWNGTGFTSAAAIPGASTLSAAAGRGDGAMAVADADTSRVMVFDANQAMVADYAGIAGPSGMAFDAAGRLYVASNAGGTIARFAAGSPPNSVPSLFARVSAPRWLEFDAGGALWVSGVSAVSRIDPSGSPTTITSGLSLGGLVADGTALVGVRTSAQQVLRWDGNAWSVFAAGLTYPEGLRALPDGGIAVASRGNGTVVKWQGGSLNVAAADLVNPHDVDVSSDGTTLYAAGDQGRAYRIASDGSVQDLGLSPLLGTTTQIKALGVRSDGRIDLAVGDSVMEMVVTQPPALPAAGSVVHTATVASAAIPATEGDHLIDFGTWVPPYGGDFSVRVARTGLTGDLASTFHVGALAEGILSVAAPDVPPGTSTVALQMRVSGADYTSVSRVETALLKPSAKVVRPMGIAADREGNVYVTDGSTLRKTTPAGLETVLASGYAFGTGMGVDSAERLYVPVRASAKYQLLRFTLDGQATVLVDNLGAAAAGVAINSRDEIFVAQTGRLLKISQTGEVSVYATAGLPWPIGISIDGKDNIYVLNSAGVVAQIKPDRSATILYRENDGTNHPMFEYEGMALTADCGESFYLAPSTWKRFDQNAEEHTLVQVNPRTGQATAILDGRKIHTDLMDMDHLVFDRFGSRILMWTDYSGGRIWQVPVTCGAISADVHLVTKPGQTLTGMARTPAAAVPLANGATEYVWSLRDIPPAGVSFGFDTLVENLSLGERRPVADSAFLMFKNTFSPTDVKLPIAVPTVQAVNLVGIAVATDQPAYPANSTAQVATRLDNTRAADAAGTLGVEILDAAGIVVGQVTRQGAVVPAGGSLDVAGGFAIGTIVPGTYTVRARLADGDTVLAEGSTAFQVIGDTANGTAVSQLSLDKGFYDAADRAVITSRAVNNSANVILENLTLSVSVADPAGTVVFTKDIAIAQLGAGAIVEYLTPYAFTSAAAGTYTVTQVLKDGSGAVLDTQTRSYQVRASADTGFGLTGTLSADPKTVPVGGPVSLSFTAANQGNAGYLGLPLAVRILAPATDAVLATFPAAVDLSAGGTHAGNQSWTTQGQAGDVLVAALTATVAGREIALAQDSFTLKGTPINLTLTQSVARASRVLALAACSGHGEGNEDEHDDHGDGHDERGDGHDGDGRQHGVTSRPGQSSSPSCDQEGDGHDDSGDDEHGDEEHGAKCGLGRAQAIDGLLSGLSIAHRVTTDPALFRSEFRSGAYTTYWISGEVKKLKDDLAEEVREAVNRGESLLLDGVHDQRNKVLEEAAGVTVRGKLGSRDQAVWLSSPVFDGQLLASTGRALKLELAGGQVAGTFGSPTGKPAFVTHGYGQGRAALFGLDLVASLTADSRWPAETGLGLGWLLPPLPTGFTPGAYVPVTLTVSNAGQEAAVEVRTTLPAGAAFIAADPPPTSPAGPIVWNFPLATGGERVLHLALRAPLAEGSHELATEIGTVSGGTFSAFGPPQVLSLTVVAAGAQLPAVQAQIQALAVARKDREDRDKAATSAAKAQAALSTGQWSDGIEDLMDAIGRLRRIESADTTAIRLALDRALKEAQWRWAQAQ